MNLSKLFDIQAKLDERIVQEHNLQGQDLLDKKILALQVELGELANEQRSWKFWSKDQRQRIENWVECTSCNGTGDLNYDAMMEDAEGSGGHEYIDCKECDSSGTSHMINPLLEEYVDCLHFILSIGLEVGIDAESIKLDSLHYRSITFAFNTVFSSVSTLESVEDAERNGLLGVDDLRETYEDVVGRFIKLGELLGFTWEQIEQAYLDKNKVNHERQNNGY